MNKAILIVGLPGSGKTHLAKAKYVPIGYVLCDDPTVLDRTLLESGKDVVFTDPHLCNSDTRRIAEDVLRGYGYEVEWVFFENNERKAKKLLKFRNDKRIITNFESFKYVIPPNTTPLEIFEA